MVKNKKNEIITLIVTIPQFDCNGNYQTEAIVKIFWNESRNSYYFWYYNQDGKQRQRSCATKDKKQAGINARVISESILTTGAKVLGAPIALRLSEYCKLYKDKHRLLLKPGTLRVIDSSFRLFMATIGDKELGKITRNDCFQFIHETGKKAQWSRTMYGHLRSAFRFAVEQGYCGSNPFTKVPKPAAAPWDGEFLTRTHFDLLFDQMPTKTFNERTRSRVSLLGFETGARLGELLALTPEDVRISTDLLSGFIDIKCSHLHLTKNNRRRQVPLSIRAIRAIMDQIEDNRAQNFSSTPHYLFTHPDGIRPISQSTISHAFKKVALKVFPNRQRIHFHTLRHSFCTLLMQAGVPAQEVMMLAGHSELKTTMIYSHLGNLDFKKSIKVLNDDTTPSASAESYALRWPQSPLPDFSASGIHSGA